MGQEHNACGTTQIDRDHEARPTFSAPSRRAPLITGEVPVSDYSTRAVHLSFGLPSQAHSLFFPHPGSIVRGSL